MGPNINNRPEGPVETPPEISPSPFAGSHILTIFITVFLVLSVTGGAYYLMRQSSLGGHTTRGDGANNLDGIPTQTIADLTSRPTVPTLNTSRLPLASPSPVVATAKSDVALYEHPTLHYMVEYPADWLVKTEPKTVVDVYGVVYIDSPDFQIDRMLQVSGASIFIDVADTTETSVHHSFVKMAGLRNVNEIREAEVDGEEAIQYDFVFEAVSAYETLFIKNGKLYVISYRYADRSGPRRYWKSYVHVLQSFKDM